MFLPFGVDRWKALQKKIFSHSRALSTENVVLGSSQIARSWGRSEAVMIMADGQTLFWEFTVPVPNI
ncbi:unnamed protein product [Alternaria burnsii]|nr:unnamed protein product [Alternaria burnsii]